jgi:hypothetical protein
LHRNPSNALPATTGLTFGDGTSNNFDAFDINGRDQTLAFLRTNFTTGTVNGITNTASGTTSTLTISGAATTTYTAVIGIPADITNLTGASNNIALTLAGTNIFTGTTTIDGSRLRLTNLSALKGTSAIGVGSGTNAQLASNGVAGTFDSSLTQSVYSLAIDDTLIAPGIYDSSSSETSGFITGTGKLQVVIPEPSTVLMLMLGIGGLVLRGRRRAL